MTITVLTREPTDQASVGIVIAGAATAVAGLASLVLLRVAGVGRSARARASRIRAVRRGAEVGAALGLVATLQVIGGLTPVTAIFVVVPFALAEYVLSAGASPSR